MTPNVKVLSKVIKKLIAKYYNSTQRGQPKKYFGNEELKTGTLNIKESHYTSVAL